MQVVQNHWKEGVWNTALQKDDSTDLVLLFGERAILEKENALSNIRNSYPNAIFLGGSTSGEIIGEEVLDHSIVLSAIKFDKTTLNIATTDCAGGADSFAAGLELAKALDHNDLTHVFVVSNGLHVYTWGIFYLWA